MTNETELLQKRIKELEAENAMYKNHGAVGLYYELNRLVNVTVEYSRNIKISELLSNENEKGDKRFERTMALIKNAKEHALDMQEIRNKLGLTGDEKKDKDSIPFIETVAETRK